MGVLDFSVSASARIANRRVHAELDMGRVNTLWITLKKDPSEPVQNFSPALLAELSRMGKTMKASAGAWNYLGQSAPVHYAVLQSDHPEYFNLGGDLSYFRRCISAKDFDSLYDYSKLCLEIIVEWDAITSQNMTTIALVQGRALGGGFEAALAADFLIAEEHSTFGFPEIMFGLFPCSGAMSLLSRRVGVHSAERMVTDKRIYSARELLEMGVIDEICSTGNGVRAVERFIATHAARRAARLAIQRSRRRMAPLDYKELLKVVEEWVEAARHLSAEELHAMDMLIMLQKGPQQKSVQTLPA